MESVLDGWRNRDERAQMGGGEARNIQQIAAGKKTARQRIECLIDAKSFVENDRMINDGVITGFGTINKRTIALYSQDFTIRGGSLGKKHAEKIVKIMDMAAKIGCPIIGIIDSGGARIEEGIHALAGYGEIFKRNCHYSGVIPQISLILGPCAGGAVYSPALTDFVFMTEKISQMFITGPQVIAEVLHQTITKEDLGGSAVHATQSGVAHVITATEDECFAKIKALFSFLPDSYLNDPPHKKQKENIDIFPEFNLPKNPNQGYDIKTLINSVIDPIDTTDGNSHNFFELQAQFAANIVTGFARINTMVVGIVANQPLVKAGTIDIDASCKAARFIQWCNSFAIPIISFVDTPGYLPGIDQEHNGIIRHGAKLLHAYATATVPKITIIIRKAFGGAFIVMGSKTLGADFNSAWPEAQIAVLGAKAAVTIMHGKKIACLAEKDRYTEQQAHETKYAEEFLNPFIAAEHGYIDAIIDPKTTRQYLIQALNITKNKIEQRPRRRHGNGPL